LKIKVGIAPDPLGTANGLISNAIGSTQLTPQRSSAVRLGMSSATYAPGYISPQEDAREVAFGRIESASNVRIDIRQR